MMPLNNDCGILMGALGEGCVATSVDDDVVLAAIFMVAYPNPFNPSTTIRFHLPEPGSVSLSIHDINGRRVVSLLDERFRDAGQYTVTWTGCDDAGNRLASGVYFTRLTSGGVSAESKLVLLK